MSPVLLPEAAVYMYVAIFLVILIGVVVIAVVEWRFTRSWTVIAAWCLLSVFVPGVGFAVWAVWRAVTAQSLKARKKELHN